MTEAVHLETPSKLMNDFLEEYRSEESVRKYSNDTAGNGISYLLNHEYAEIYLDVLENCIPKSRRQKGVRLWEFGCGAGMNLLHLVSLMQRRGIAVDCAYGTDFSETLVEAARSDAQRYLPSELSKKVSFCLAKNESLVEDVTRELGIPEEKLLGSFDLLLGVNTIRYSHRLSNHIDCARGIYNLLAKGGVCVNIDMNDKFPAFRSRISDWKKGDALATYIPSLDKYAEPFESVGFEILRKENFCWIPHSAGRGMTVFMKTLTPVLNAIARSRAMRSLVIARKV
ncbi:MAG TPA: class I SAM-dependent methyltransferase [Candidatus Acidoferrum sp.]